MRGRHAAAARRKEAKGKGGDRISKPAPFDAAAGRRGLLEADRRRPEARGRPVERKPQRPAPPAIDPRIAARRADVKAEEAAAAPRRGRRLAMATMALVVVLCAGALALLSPLASVRTIEVVGAARTAPAEIRLASGLSGEPLARIDQEGALARMVALPWVERASLERRWPRTVVLSVVERRPVAVAPCAAATPTCLVDASGRVLAPTSDDVKAASTLPRLAAVPAAGAPGAWVPEAVRGPLAVAVALPPALRPLVRGVRGDNGDVVLDLQAPGREQSPPVVRLGAPDRIVDKLTAAATVLARTSVNGLAVLDVRVPESPALTRVRR